MGGSARAAWLALTMCGLPLGTPAVAAALVLRDAAQHDLRLEQPPRRIITLLPSLTETVCALGECARLIATDRYSNWPVSVQALPKAGGLDDAQIELMVGLQPDVVVLAHALRVTERLRLLGVATFDVETVSYADIARTVTALGQLLGVPQRAIALNLEIERSVDAVVSNARASLHGRHPLVYYEIDAAPYGAGPGSFIGELLTRLGARNILGAELGPFPKLNPEYVVTHEPDVIFIAPAAINDLARRPGWEQMRSVQESRLCAFSDPVRDTLVRPGPRVAEGLRAMAECLTRVAP